MGVKAFGLVARRGKFVLDIPMLDITSGGTALLGPNGAGKTTLLLALQGLIPASGTIERPGRTASVFAQPAVLRGTVLWNVSISCQKVLGTPQADADAGAITWLHEVGLACEMNSDARTLSTGQRQRLGIARALALEPAALFLDEPLANVDADGRPALRALLGSYVERTGCVIVIATSSLADTVALCREVVTLRDGCVTYYGGVSSLASTENPYIAALRVESDALPLRFR